MRSEAAIYLYCILRAQTASERNAAPPGLPHTGPARLIELGAVSLARKPAVQKARKTSAPRTWMVVADAPRREYGPERIEAGLQDLDWVSACALAHEAVVESFLEIGDLIPLKLFTLFDDEERAAEHLRARSGDLDKVFERIAGCREWSVRCTRATAPARAAAPRAPQPESAESGREFLMRKSRARSAVAGSESREKVDETLEQLSSLARESVRIPIQAQGVRLLADVALLVPRREEQGFCARAEELARELGLAGFELAMTGPWPPYHFAGDAR